MLLSCNGLPQEILYFKKEKYYTVLKRLHENTGCRSARFLLQGFSGGGFGIRGRQHPRGACPVVCSCWVPQLGAVRLLASRSPGASAPGCAPQRSSFWRHEAGCLHRGRPGCLETTGERAAKHATLQASVAAWLLFLSSHIQGGSRMRTLAATRPLGRGSFPPVLGCRAASGIRGFYQGFWLRGIHGGESGGHLGKGKVSLQLQ